MSLTRAEVRDLARVARSIPAVIRDERYSGFGRASIAAERASAVALGLELLHEDMPSDTAEHRAAPVVPPSPQLSADAIELAAFRYEPEQCAALQQIAHLPQFVLALLACEGVDPEEHTRTITAYVRSLIASYQKAAVAS
jgi:hypothetical protein